MIIKVSSDNWRHRNFDFGKCRQTFRLRLDSHVISLKIDEGQCDHTLQRYDLTIGSNGTFVMQDVDCDMPIEIALQEIEQAERFASEYRVAIDARQIAGHDTTREECLLERFLAAIQNASFHYDGLIHEQQQRRKSKRATTIH